MQDVIDVEGYEVPERPLLPRAGAGDFRPGLASYGGKSTRSDYPTNRKQQLLETIDKIALAIREGKNDPGVIGYAGDVIAMSGAKMSGTRKRVQVIVDEVQKIMTYAPDPIGAEYLKSAAGMLCLRPGLCVRVGDCDDLLVLTGSMCCGVGIHCQIVGLYYGENTQPHVLMVFEDDDGEWLYADPTAGLQPGTRKVALGFAPPKPKEEFWADPLESMNGPEIVTVGVGALTSGWRRADGRWWTKEGDEWFRSDASGEGWQRIGAGALPPEVVNVRARAPKVGAGAVPSWRYLGSGLAALNQILGGHRYSFSCWIDTSRALPGLPPLDAQVLADGWDIEKNEVGARMGDLVLYNVVGICKSVPVRNTDTVEYVDVFVEVVGDVAPPPGQVPGAGPAPQVPGTPSPDPLPPAGEVGPPAPNNPPDDQNGVGFGTVLAWGAGVALVTGIVWGAYKTRHTPVPARFKKARAA